MKCENCGKNEVSFIYQSNINGRVTEKHLCGECADKLGYTQKVAAQSRRMMEGMRSAFSGFFAPERSLLGAGGLFGQELFDDFFRDMPALDEAPAELAAGPQRQETDISREEQGRFARMRELNKLRVEMKKAARAEDFERAAELRDQIRAMEQEGRENN